MLILPVYNIIVLPNSTVYIHLKSFMASAGKKPVQGERVLLLVAKTPDDGGTPVDAAFEQLGVTGKIAQENVNGFVEIATDDRVLVDDVEVGENGGISLTTTPSTEEADLTAEEEHERYLVALKSILDVTRGQNWGGWIEQTLTHVGNLNGIAGVLGYFTEMSPEDRYSLLKQNSLRTRAEMVEDLIGEHVEGIRLMVEGQRNMNDEQQKRHREHAIKKQLSYLQNELDNMHPDSLSDLRRIEQAVEECGMNEEAKTEAQRVLRRMKTEGEDSQEYSKLLDYMELLVRLPWKKAEPKHIDLTQAREILDADHYGLKKVKDRIVQQIAVLDLKQQQTGSILCFVGAPGTGKTSIGKSIADALGREYVRVSLGGVRDESDIRGHRRTYVGAMAGRIIDCISKVGSSNPVMLLDEIDKLSSSYNGDPASALLEVLDPEQNKNFTDHYLNVPFDLSDVFFICTANSLETIPAPLLNRMEVIQFDGYTESEKYQIAARHLLPHAEEATGIPAGHVHVSEDVMHAIIADYTREGGVRGLKKRLDTLCRTAAVKIVSGESDELDVQKDQLREYLDMHPIRHDLARESEQPGVVTGLAWTQAGGDVLHIETLFTKGSGKVQITGQLGDVMKESVQIATSLVKAAFPDKVELFEQNDLHVHVPAGATPKDGPSAGITLTSALSSLVTGVAVDPHIAMTGEVSLRGLVTAIGGLPEKLMAAKRAGVTKVLIPEENVDDLDDIADEVKDSLQIVPVRTVSEALEQIGLAAKEA